MQMLEAISFHPSFMTLVSGGSCCVHSFSTRTIYLLSSQSELLCIGRKDIPNGPVTLVTSLAPSESMYSLAITPGAKTRLMDNFLFLGNDALCISLNAAEPWQSSMQPPPVQSSPQSRSQAIACLQQALIKGGRRSSLAPLLEFKEAILLDAECSDIALDATVEKAVTSVKRTLQSILARNVTGTRDGIEGLVGLGPGLTPAGDDLLAGLIASLWYLFGNTEQIRPYLEDIGAAVGTVINGRTTLVSQTLLKYAFHGQFNETIIDLFACMTEDSDRLMEKAELLLALGGTSGTNILTGIVFGLHIGAKIQGLSFEQ